MHESRKYEVKTPVTRTLLPPGPKGRIVVGALLSLRKRPLEFLTEAARKFGDVVYMKMGRVQLYMLSHPDLIEQVLITDNRNFVKPWLLREAADVLGNGLLTSDGELWMRQRRLMQPAFHRSRILNHAAVMTRRTERMMEEWRDGRELDIHDQMMKLTLDIVAETLFGAEVEDRHAEVGHALELSLQRFVDQLSPLRFLNRLPLPRNIRFRRAVRKLDAIIYSVIDARRKDPDADRNDLLSLLLHAHDDQEGDEGGMSDRQLRDEAVTLFLAGHETTAIALSWTWYLLASAPDVEERLHAELDEVIGDRLPTPEDLPRLRYTEMVLRESMRLYPPAWRIGREVAQECEVGGYRLPLKAQILICQWIVHRDPRFFADPDSFRPERWEEEGVESLPRFAYFPFGGGGRRCIGDYFAQMEGVLVLATIARRYRIELTGRPAAEPFPTITLRPRYGIGARLRRR